jgi:hypothetical protein
MAAASITVAPPISVTSRRDGHAAAPFKNTSNAAAEAMYLRWTVMARREEQEGNSGARNCASQRWRMWRGVLPIVRRSAVFCARRVART